MTEREVGRGGFYLPRVYQKDQVHIERSLEEAEVDYIDLAKWSFVDEFLCFILQADLLSFVDKTYPNPRDKNDIPIWFLISCQFLMRLYQTGKYDHLRYLLQSGSILARYGFNVGSKTLGFNNKHQYERSTAVDADAVRKFFRDTDRDEIRVWYRKNLQQ